MSHADLSCTQQATGDRGACQPLSAEALVEALAAKMERLLADGVLIELAVHLTAMTNGLDIWEAGSPTAKALVAGVASSILDPHPVRRLQCYREALAAARRVVAAGGGR